jgi:hypothetical protein
MHQDEKDKHPSLLFRRNKDEEKMIDNTGTSSR